MCGIAGFISNAGGVPHFAEQGVRRMVASMRARGPDAEGVWANAGAVLGHRRLAILDLDERANQPMASPDGRYAIVFNGEIYNFRKLRLELEADGVTFRTNSDTEVLLALFAREGERMLPRLRGMFAFAIWDTQLRELFCARDSYGIKPLYYSRTRNGVAFASQVKALRASGLVTSEREPAGLAGFYLWGSVPEPWTIYRGVFALPAGHWLRVHSGVADTPISWHDIADTWRGARRDSATLELREVVRKAVEDSVHAHLVADVPVSVLLSGGIDSGVVAALAAESGTSVEGITIGFEEFAGGRNDEVPVAQSVAAYYGMRHHVRMVSRNEFERDIPRILAAMDQPSIDGVNTWFASKAVAERGYKVALSGIGGDELFCGYSLFRQLPSQAALGRAIASIPGVKHLLRGPCAGIAKWRSQPKYAGLPELFDTLEGLYFLRRGLFLPSELPALMGDDVAAEGMVSLCGFPPGMSFAEARDDAAALSLLESTLYLRNQLLRDSDWASMGHSVELRTPLVDAKLLDAIGPFVSKFSGGAGKAMLAQAPKMTLPEAIMNRPKAGFSLPIATWLSKSLHARPADNSTSATSTTPWARRWARTVLAEAVY